MKSMPVMAHPVPKAADEDNCIDDISSCKWGAVAREQQEGAWYEAGNPSDSGEDEDDEGSPPMAMSKLSSGLRRQPTRKRGREEGRGRKGGPTWTVL